MGVGVGVGEVYIYTHIYSNGSSSVMKKSVEMWQEMMIKEEAEEEEIERLFMGVMGGYRDAFMPPLTDFSAMNQMGSSSSYGCKKQRKEDPMLADSIHKERNRRGKTAEMYSLLQSLIPTISHIHKVLLLSISSIYSNY